MGGRGRGDRSGRTPSVSASERLTLARDGGCRAKVWTGGGRASVGRIALAVEGLIAAAGVLRPWPPSYFVGA